jgi:hypothetical protein
VKKVAIIHEGLRQIHAESHNANTATLCGLDGFDPGGKVDQASGGAVRRGEKIDCPECLAIWKTARGYRSSDFADYKRGMSS